LDSENVNIREFTDSNTLPLIFKIAAAILLAFSVYFLVLLFDKNEIVLQANSTQTQQLPDSSIITLKSGAILTYEDKFDSQTRAVQLSGSAFFEITKNPKRPFIIDLDEVQVVVLGTSFYIDAVENEAEIEVGVESGSVAVINKATKDTVRLKPDEKLIYKRSLKQFSRVEKMDYNSIFWKTNTLIFKNENLSKVIETLEDKYKVSIEVEDQNILNCRVSGRFKDETIANILEKLALSFGWELERKQGFVLKGKGC
jgi:ferric-dicitrate binding protein FerR (iron transport regulator)